MSKVILSLLLCLAASDDQDSSYSTEAQGLQKLSQQVVALSTQIEDTSAALSSVLDSQLTVTENTASAELRIELGQVEEDLDEVSAEIEELEAELDSRQAHCPYLESCTKCTSNYSCVWCSSLNKCVAGDSQGPYNGECTSYQYEQCNHSGCSRYTECGSCINDSSCGWCLNGQYCLEGSTEDTGDCHYDFFYSSASVSNHDCPADSSSVSKDSNTLARTRTADEDDMVERLDELHQEKIKIENAIEDLDEMLDKVHELADDARGIDYGHSTVFYDLDSLASEAHELYEDERKD
jgi:predicted  nucleic acid-binding Zn-ribbon protein